MICQALLQTTPGSISDHGVTWVNITHPPPVPALLELKAMEEMSKRNGILVLRVSGHWPSLRDLPGKIARHACVSPMPSLGLDRQ